jgi:uncharacterized protein (DUF2252 family)
MLTSPFAFFRGSAVLQATDLGANAHTGLTAQLCGDAHLSNFGIFGSPDRRLVFDINDFDETLPGPWEWDVKRLAASVAVAGRSLGLSRKKRIEIVEGVVASYRERMRELAKLGNLTVWYARLEVEQIMQALSEQADSDALKRLGRIAEKAYTRDSLREYEKLTHIVDGEPRILGDPPLIVPIEDLTDGMSPDEIRAELQRLFDIYVDTLNSDRQHLLKTYRLVHIARKVVGVGSVGTRSWIVLLLGRDDQDPLFIQVKEAQASVLEEFLPESEYETAGERVVAGQRLMQASTDIMLGWERVIGVDGIQRDFYLRQLKDWKGSANIAKMTDRSFGLYSALCGRVLARAHARSGDRVAIAAYLGKSDTFDKAVAEYAELYADQNESDFAVVEQAERDGKLEVLRGV